MPFAGDEADDQGIIFRISVPETEARSATTTLESFLDEGFHVSAFCPEVNTSGTLEPYFTALSASPLEGMSGCFGIFDQSSERCI